MKAVARLVRAYFTASAPSRWLSGIGGAGLALMTVVTLTHPEAIASWGMLAINISAAALFLGSTLMPLMLGHLVERHYPDVVPGGRRALYWSAFVTVLILALPVPILAVLALPRYGASVLQLALHMAVYFVPIFFITSWFYVALGCIVRQRNVASVVLGTLILVLVVFLPMQYIGGEMALMVVAIECVLTWLLFAAYVFGYPHLRRTGFVVRWQQLWKNLRVRPRVRAGREVDIVLGIASPLLFALPLALPAFLATMLDESLSAWIFMMTIFSTVSGALAATAASRSRGIWLRTHWTREQLFSQVERRFWRHNGASLAALIAVPLVISALGKLPDAFFAKALPLMLLGMTLSTYLGLMQTQSLRLRDAALGSALMLALMLLAGTSAEGSGRWLYELELALAALALALRYVARARWTGLDWRLCRTEGRTAARSTA